MDELAESFGVSTATVYNYQNVVRAEMPSISRADCLAIVVHVAEVVAAKRRCGCHARWRDELMKEVGRQDALNQMRKQREANHSALSLTHDTSGKCSEDSPNHLFHHAQPALYDR